MTNYGARQIMAELEGLMTMATHTTIKHMKIVLLSVGFSEHLTCNFYFFIAFLDRNF